MLKARVLQTSRLLWRDSSASTVCESSIQDQPPHPSRSEARLVVVVRFLLRSLTASDMNSAEQTVTWLISLGVLESPKKSISDPEAFLQTSLQDGAVLCRLLDKLRPGTVKVSVREDMEGEKKSSNEWLFTSLKCWIYKLMILNALRNKHVRIVIYRCALTQRRDGFILQFMCTLIWKYGLYVLISTIEKKQPYIIN